MRDGVSLRSGSATRRRLPRSDGASIDPGHVVTMMAVRVDVSFLIQKFGYT